jgi:hypothetical protein
LAEVSSSQAVPTRFAYGYGGECGNDFALDFALLGIAFERFRSYQPAATTERGFAHLVFEGDFSIEGAKFAFHSERTDFISGRRNHAAPVRRQA